MPLLDTFGRDHTDMRLSLTDHCNFRCFYCMKEDQKFEPMRLELSTPELIRIARIARELGIVSLRLTGGEPLMRKDAVDVVRQLAALGFSDLSMTTNGSLLTRDHGGVTLAQALRDAGLNRLNVSCDSLDPEKFARIRRRGDLSAVWDGIRAAQDAGFSPIKMNVVLIRGENDDEIIDFARLARDSARAGAPIVVRFIEFMPLGETGEKQANWTPEKVVDSQDVLATIRERWPLEIATRQGDHAPASRWRFSDGVGEIGVIPTMTNPFCANCNRLRVTADGFVMRCLFSEKELPFSLRNMMRRREGSTDGEVAAVFREAVRTKKAGQDRDVPDILTRPDGYLDGSRNVSGVTMSQIGG
jgi:cyclic pyranopterin phosphate synthase